MVHQAFTSNQEILKALPALNWCSFHLKTLNAEPQVTAGHVVMRGEGEVASKVSEFVYRKALLLPPLPRGLPTHFLLPRQRGLHNLGCVGEFCLFKQKN